MKLYYIEDQTNRQKLDLHFSINDTKIDCVTETLFWGVIIDECLTWKPHIQNLTRKISEQVKKHEVGITCENILLEMYMALIQIDVEEK